MKLSFLNFNNNEINYLFFCRYINYLIFKGYFQAASLKFTTSITC